MTSKVVLITGASSGMGKEAALQFAAQGHKVYAAARRIDSMEQELAPNGIVPISVDVTKADDNQRAVDQIIEAEGRIDVLINNAGFGLYGAVEDVPIDDARYQFEVNLFGLADLTQRVLPHMRAQQAGRIINTSSMGGKIFTPLGAWYHATKHALEGWSDCLRIETAPFGIQVVVIEPGGVKTEFADVVGRQLEKYYGHSAYDSQMKPFIDMMGQDNAMMDRLTEPEVLGAVFVEAATARKPKRRYVKGYGARPALFIRKWFGDGAYEYVIKRMAR
ncbi:MAG: oxidoreductase [Actinomycetota bacterium]